ncbi:PaaI family thioesterase [Microvirga sp. BT291]|nr:PaaI family thioesterase [Microvirga pudoricolor]
MTKEEVEAFLEREFPQMHHGGQSCFIEEIGPHSARMRMAYQERHLRPGGTISGPAMMALADYVLYAAILGSLGPIALAVTTNLSFNFLRKPLQRDLMAKCRLLKVGRRLVMGEVAIVSEGSADIVCHATGTYALP